MKIKERITHLQLPLHSTPWLAGQITLFYVSFAALWLLGGNQLLAQYVHWGAQHELYELFADILFIAVSSSALYMFSRQGIARLKESSGRAEIADLRWKALIENSTDAILICDETMNVKYASPALAKILGYEPEEVYSMPVQQTIHPDDLPVLAMHVAQVVSSPGLPVIGQSRYRHKNGEWRVMEGMTSNHLADPLINGLVINIRDITDRSIAEERIQKSNLTAHALLNAFSDSAFLLDISGKILEINEAATREFELSRDDLLGKSVFDLFPLPVAQSRQARFEEMLRSGVALTVEDEHDGHWYSAVLYPICDDSGAATGVAVLSRDITEQHNSRLILQESEQKYRLLVDDSPEATIVHQEGAIVFANLAAAHLLGMATPQELVGTQILPYIAPVSLPIVIDRTKRMLAGEIVPTVQETFCKVDGTPVDVEVRAARLTYNGKPAIQVHGIDITERLAAQEKIAASLREKEILLKEIHHRVKNNLQVISSLLNLQSHLLPNVQDRELFTTAQNRVRSMALVHELLYKSSDLRHINFDNYLRSIAVLLQQTLGDTAQDISIDFDLEPVQLNIENAVPFGLIATELFTNCLKHGFKNRSTGIITLQLQALPNERCMLRISDNGVGLPDGFNLTSTTTLGLQLVPTLCEQIGASLTHSSSNGTTSFAVTMLG